MIKTCNLFVGLTGRCKVENNILKTKQRGDNSFFESFIIGDLEVSIQGSHTHSCTPKEILPSLNDYSSLEIAIFNDTEWIHPTNEIFKDFKQQNQLISLWEDQNNPTHVGGFVPKALILELLTYLEEELKNATK